MLVIAVLLLVLIWRGTKGIKYKLEWLYRPIDYLLQRGYDMGFLVIEFPYSKKFVQLRKYVHSDIDYGIELGFPRVKWSIQYFDEIEDFCITNKIPYSIEKNAYKEPALDFLYIDFGKDSKKAYDIVRKILVEVFGADENTKFFVQLSGAEPDL